MLCALIMAGGKGTRFWPLSTEEKPKQFLKLVGDETMIQMTVNRIKPIIPLERIFICTGEKYIDLVKDQLPDLSDRNIILEPEGRNTAPCIALSSLYINRFYEDSTMVVLPSDHLINDEKNFIKIIKNSENFLSSEKQAIVTLGMKPDRAETGYGYIKSAQNKILVNEDDFIKVEKFVEKPNLQLAQSYLESGDYLWNGGMFLWKTKHIIDLIKVHLSNTYEVLKEVENISIEKLKNYINENYKNTDNISIDYAILEKSDNIYVVPADIGWDDIGNWGAYERYNPKDEHKNIKSGEVSFVDSKKNIAITLGKKIVLYGVEDLFLVEKDDYILITSKNKLEELKENKDRLVF
ncbi:mannose-1-phosphate guanylyltransferase [Clostridium intestinale]|uniref:mannose-1-phosphate guanylyltransferase n=1 Tax=Clostridium intestinale TaxID=36845 RepID=UPI0028ED66E2|nr:mannose-1-phosphate guanylyltransferase [Clostridium intestinale]